MPPRDALAAAVKDLRQQAGNKLIGFIVDLRNNPGGNFDAAVAAADAFIDKGDITVVKSRKAEDAKRIAATPGDLANGLPIVALVNGGTAREAELVAGALQDSSRAVLLGTKTFGESAIETLIPLNGNGAIRLTTARFLTPSGRAIQGKGLEPDLVVIAAETGKGGAGGPAARGRSARRAEKHRPAQDRAAGQGNRRPAMRPSRPTPQAARRARRPRRPRATQPTVATGDIGTASDEQLSEAIDVLRGLALVNGRAPHVSSGSSREGVVTELPQAMRYIEMTAPGGPEVLTLATGPVPPRAGRSADPRRRRRRQPARRACSGGQLSAAAGRSPTARASKSPGRSRRSATGVDAWRSATRSARWSPAAAMPSTASPPAAQCLPVPDGCRWSRPAALPETFFTVWTQCVRSRRG